MRTQKGNYLTFYLITLLCVANISNEKIHSLNVSTRILTIFKVILQTPVLDMQEHSDNAVQFWFCRPPKGANHICLHGSHTEFMNRI